MTTWVKVNGDWVTWREWQEWREFRRSMRLDDDEDLSTGHVAVLSWE